MWKCSYQCQLIHRLLWHCSSPIVNWKHAFHFSTSCLKYTSKVFCWSVCLAYTGHVWNKINLSVPHHMQLLLNTVDPKSYTNNARKTKPGYWLLTYKIMSSFTRSWSHNSTFSFRNRTLYTNPATAFQQDILCTSLSLEKVTTFIWGERIPMEATTFTKLQVQVKDFPLLKHNILHRFPLHPQSDENVYSFIFS